MKRKIICLLSVLTVASAVLSGCSVELTDPAMPGAVELDFDEEGNVSFDYIENEAYTETSAGEAEDDSIIRYHFADRDEAVECYLSNEEYFAGFSDCELQYKTGHKNATIDELKEFGASQMEEYTDEEKAGIERTLKEMEEDLKKSGFSLPKMDEITLIKSTQQEENDSGAYTHGTKIFFGQRITDKICSEDEKDHIFGKCVFWHEIFHCLTRNNPDFRADMYKIIGFTVQDEDFELPDTVYERFISNPDVEHHNSYAAFKIDGEEIDCFLALIAEKPFEKEGDSFFDCMSAALVPIDGTDTYYLPEDAENFWDVMGENTDYVIDPEECMADNFSYAMTYGMDGKKGEGYKTPKIIEEIIEYVSK